MYGGRLGLLDADPWQAHLVCHGGRGAAAEEAVEDQAVLRAEVLEDMVDETFGLFAALKRHAALAAPVAEQGPVDDVGHRYAAGKEGLGSAAFAVHEHH